MLKKILMFGFITFCLMSFVTESFAGTKAVSAARAANYMGQKVMACGKLAQVKHIKNRHFLNLDAPYPHQSLSVLIWGEDYSAISAKLNSPEANIGKIICAFGTVSEYKKNVQIVVKKPQNIDYAR